MISSTRKLRFGMIGGGPGAFIGVVHRRAAEIDGLAELVAGAFSSDPEKSRAQGALWGIDPSRVYESFELMAKIEYERSPQDRLDFIVIVTPNHLHWPIARCFIERGFHVVCDKPLTTSVSDAESLCSLVSEKKVIFALTHAYAGYPMVKQARSIVRGGSLGSIRKLHVEYHQGWLAKPIENLGHKQAAWRTDPSKAGAGALGDIGTHCLHLVQYVTGLQIERLLADVATIVPGRKVDDDVNILVHYVGGARGVLSCSQVATGEENGLCLRVYGSEGSIEWRQEDANTLLIRRNNTPIEMQRAGQSYLCEEAKHATRLPSGHNEGLTDAFANIYANVIRTITAKRAGVQPSALDLDFPTAQDGLVGVHFVETALKSSKEGGVWVNAKK